MNFGERDVKKLTVIVLVALLLILVFLVIKPVILATLGGLILAYVFMPLYKKINRIVPNRTVTAFIVVALIIIIALSIIWFITPLVMEQVFDLYGISQNIGIQHFLQTIFPSASESFIGQLGATLNGFISKASSGALNSLLDVFLEFPKILLNLFIVGFVFFFALRDSDQLKLFFKGLSPFNETKEKVLVKHFKDMTDSVIYGQVIVGIVQGLLAGLGLLLFGVENALVLTLLAIFFSIIPFIGPALVWIPVSIYMFSTGASDGLALGFIAYNLFIVSLADNLLRSYLISRRTNISQAVVMVGMVGGLFVFGILGLIIGPLILAYLITLLESFKDRSIYSLFSDNTVAA